MSTSIIKGRPTLNDYSLTGNRTSYDFLFNKGWTDGDGYIGASLSATQSIANSTAVRPVHITLTPGVWIGFIEMGWAEKLDGTRRLKCTDSSGNLLWDWAQLEAPACQYGNSGQQLYFSVIIPQNTTIYAEVYQTSGAALNLTLLNMRFRRI